MRSEISTENEQFIQNQIDNGHYQSRGELLDEAIELLKKRRQLLAHIDEGTPQL